MKLFDVDIKKLAILLLPTFLRQSLFLALIGSAVRALGQTHIEFAKYREDVDYRRNHNGQVCYLQAALNDSLDTELRRIRISDTYRTMPVVFYPVDDEKPVVFDSSTPVVFERQDLFGANMQDFEVLVPADVFAVQTDIYNRSEKEIVARSIINQYRLAGKRFIIKN